MKPRDGPVGVLTFAWTSYSRGVEILDPELRRATASDVDALMGLVSECIAAMREQGIDQWDDVYPDRATIQRDVDDCTAFVASIASKIAGMGVLNEHQDPEYAQVSWLFSGRAGVIHRFMTAPAAEGTGVARALMAFLEGRAESLGLDCIRLDAFQQNARALRFYERSLYRRAGQVRLRKGDFFCYEKRLARVG